MLGIIVIAVGRILQLRKPAAECRIGDKFLVQRLEVSGAFQAEGLCDFLLEGLTQRDPRDPCERQLGQGDAAAGINMLFAVGPDSAQLRCVAFAVQYVFQ